MWSALGITNQRETTIVWDRATGKPVSNAIVWQDRRTAPMCARLREEGVEETIRAKTGLLLDPYFSATKIAWMLDNVDGVRARAERGELAFGTVDSWLIWNLTKGKRHVTDRTNASRTLLYNIVADRWDEELLRIFGIPASMMPEVVWSSEEVGRVTAALGPADVPIAGIAGDQQSALFGQLCTQPGDAKCTYGTGCFLLENIGANFRLSQQRLVTTLACSTAAEARICAGGQHLYRRRGGAVAARQDAFLLLRAGGGEHRRRRAGAGGVVFVPAFTGLGAPHWDPYASGMIIGIGRDTGIGHIARAAIESIAFQVADVLKAMDADTGIQLHGTARGWRRGGERSADAVPGGSAGHPRQPAGHSGVDGAGSGVSGGTGDRLLDERGGDCEDAGRARVRSPRESRRNGPAVRAMAGRGGARERVEPAAPHAM